jgi:hypothetical protein
MKLAVLAAVAALAGCANTPASEVADLDLCRYQLRGGQNAMVAQQEANRRGLDCRPYFSTLAAQDAANNAAANQALQFFTPRAAPMPPPSMMDCRTVRIGGTLRTQCY